MKLKNIFLSIGAFVFAALPVFAETSSAYNVDQIAKIVEQVQNNQLQYDYHVEPPFVLEAKEADDSGNAQFKLLLSSLKTDHTYICLVGGPQLNPFNFYAFTVQKDGQFVPLLGQEPRFSIEIAPGDMCITALLDLNDKSYKVGIISPFPEEHALGEGRSVRFSYSFPYPVLHTKFKGLEPNEAVTVEWQEDGEKQELTFNMDGKGSRELDLWASDCDGGLDITTSKGKETVGVNPEDPERPKKVAIISLQ